MVKKKLKVNGGGTQWASLETVLTYDNEGRRVTMKYPDWSGGTGKTYSYGFDTIDSCAQRKLLRAPVRYLGRGNRMTDVGAGVDVVTGVAFNAAGQVTAMTYGAQGLTVAETRSYNLLGQLTRITVPGAGLDLEYYYSGTQNNGRATGMKNYYTGETLTYQYDSINRLISAAGTASSLGGAWSQSYTFDGFGNKSGGYAVDPGTNRIVGFSYDANGNPGGPTWDIENRMVANLNDSYGYAADNRRVYRRREISGGQFQEEVYFWGLDGRMGTYKMQGPYGALTLVRQEENVYFGGRVIFKRGLTADTTMFSDRGGSIAGRKTSGGTERNYYWPWGEERVATANEREKFGTYFRDGNGIDYADQRYYQSQYGRFMTADPNRSSSRLIRPQSWNRYAYVEGDPVNFRDPNGLESEGPPDSGNEMIYCPFLGHVVPRENCPKGYAGDERSPEQCHPGTGCIPPPPSCHRTWETAPLEDQEWSDFANEVMTDEELADAAGLGAGVTPQSVNPQAGGGNQAVPALAALTAANWVLYWARTPQGQYYIGVTTNFAVRQAQHLASGRFSTVVQLGSHGRMDYFSAKALEQAYITMGGGPGNMANRINSIAASNPLFQAAQGWASTMLNSLRECSAGLPPWAK